MRFLLQCDERVQKDRWGYVQGRYRAPRTAAALPWKLLRAVRLPTDSLGSWCSLLVIRELGEGENLLLWFRATTLDLTNSNIS